MVKYRLSKAFHLATEVHIVTLICISEAFSLRWQTTDTQLLCSTRLLNSLLTSFLHRFTYYASVCLWFSPPCCHHPSPFHFDRFIPGL